MSRSIVKRALTYEKIPMKEHLLFFVDHFLYIILFEAVRPRPREMTVCHRSAPNNRNLFVLIS